MRTPALNKVRRMAFEELMKPRAIEIKSSLWDKAYKEMSDHRLSMFRNEQIDRDHFLVHGVVVLRKGDE